MTPRKYLLGIGRLIDFSQSLGSPLESFGIKVVSRNLAVRHACRTDRNSNAPTNGELPQGHPQRHCLQKEGLVSCLCCVDVAASEPYKMARSRQTGTPTQTSRSNSQCHDPSWDCCKQEPILDLCFASRSCCLLHDQPPVQTDSTGLLTGPIPI